MTMMASLRSFIAQEPVIAASCIIGGIGLFLPAVVRPMLDSFETGKKVPPPPLSEVSTSCSGAEFSGALAKFEWLKTFIA
ncbi:hypothetical protein LINPERHAP1_LOCUS20172 [Linum perenne]